MTEQFLSEQGSPRGFDRRIGLKSLGFSLTINALCPFLLYRALQSHFPENSVIPLLYATIFPVLGLIVGLVRKRTIDAIAILAMAGLALHIVVTLLAPTVRAALVIRSFDGAAIGLVLVISALIGRPIILYVAKQAVAGGTSERAASFNRMIENDGAHAFFIITLVWGVALMAMSGLHVLLALTVPPAEYLLVSPIVGVVTILAVLAWSGRYVAARIGTLSASQ